MRISIGTRKQAEARANERADAARRLLRELRDLERCATDADLPTLAYLIDLAIIEAERAAKASDGA